MLLISYATKRTFDLSISFLSVNLNYFKIKPCKYYWIFKIFQGYSTLTNKQTNAKDSSLQHFKLFHKVDLIK